jgi:hypothetical protein
MKMNAVMNYTNFYAAPCPADPFVLLNAYPTDLIILRLSKINALLYYEPAQGAETQQDIFKACFPNMQNEGKMKVIAQFRDPAYGKDTIFFTSPPLLKLMSLCFQNYTATPPDDPRPHILRFEDDLFDSLLIQNENYYGGDANNLDLNSYEGIWHLLLMQQHYLRAHGKVLFIAPIVHLFFYRFMVKSFPGGPELLKEFSESLGLKNYFNYYFLFMNILNTTISDYNKKKEIKYVLDLRDSEIKIIQYFSLRKEDFLGDKYKGSIHSELIPHPFYFIQDKHTAVLDFHFFSFTAELSIAYNFYMHSSLNKSGQFPTFPDFKSALGKLFYEEFLLGQLFKTIYKKKNHTVFQAGETSLYPDHTVVRNQREIIMMEVKSSDIHYQVFEGIDISLFKKFLDEKFCKKKTGSKSKNIGVHQLVTQIINFATTSKLDALLKVPADKNKATIYPVIVYSENAMDIAGVNSYLNDEFERSIEPYRHHFKKIFPLTTINYRFFLRHYLKQKNDPTLLTGLISSYRKRVINNSGRFTKTNHPYNFLEKHISFEQYTNEKLSTEDHKENFSEIARDFKLNEE